MQVLFEDNHLLVVNKPAGLPTMGAEAGVETLVARAKAYLKKKYKKPGNVYVGVVSRLDALVSGVIVLARTSKAAARLNEQFRSREVGKQYWALAEGQFAERQATWTDWLRRNENQHRMAVCRKTHPEAQRAELTYCVLGQQKGYSHVKVELLTGRKHQIRVQFAHREHPLLGDIKYGSRRKFPTGIALHSRRLTIQHPVRHETLDFVAPLPSYWPIQEEV